MIKFEINNLGGLAPVIICDHCGERIKDTKDGVTFYTGSGGIRRHQ